MTTKQDAMEAAARAVADLFAADPDGRDSLGSQDIAQAAVQAYLAAREAEGIIEVRRDDLQRLALGTGGMKLARQMLASHPNASHDI